MNRWCWNRVLAHRTAVRMEASRRVTHRKEWFAQELDGWAERLGRYRHTHDPYIFFNNDYHAHALRNAASLDARLQHIH